MIDNVINLFNALFSACLQFEPVILFLGAVALTAVLSAVFSYILKGKY